ncbi:MAG: hypothetical protein ABSG53_04245 [Thermoguttaceae bacterium]
MAKKMKPGQKRCPSCGASVSGPRTKTCPKCGHEFNGKPQELPAPAAASATILPVKPTKNGGTNTLDRPQVNKTQAVRDYLKTHSGATNGEIATALNKQGIDITPGHVSAIKTKFNKTGIAKKETRKEVVAEVTASALAVVEKPATSGVTITLEQVKMVAQTVKTLGGLQHVTEVLEVIRELGGVKKFKDLAEAISATETDDIPF